MLTISARNMSWEPSSFTSVTLHSRLSGASPMDGQETFSEVTGVSFCSLNLSKSLPDLTPHQSVAKASSSVVRFITNSFVSAIMSWENLSFLTEMYVIGGLELTIPVHAIVIILGVSPSLPQLTITAGTGAITAPELNTLLFIIPQRPPSRRPPCHPLNPQGCTALPGTDNSSASWRTAAMRGLSI